MGITRNGPVHNMDTNQPLVMMLPNKRFTRAQAHRLLKTNNVPHDPSAPMQHLLYLMGMNSINPSMIPPGKLPEDNAEKESSKKPILTLVSSLPNNVPKLRAICKDKKVMFKLTDKKSELLERLRQAGIT